MEPILRDYWFQLLLGIVGLIVLLLVLQRDF